MKISIDERTAIRTVLACGERFGYGNLVAHLNTAWAKHLVRNGWSERAARSASDADVRGYPFAMQDDLVERGEWDETGRRYAKPAKKRARR